MTTTPTLDKQAQGRGWLLAPVIGFMLIAAVFALALRTGDPSKLPSALIGKPAPALPAVLLDGLPPAVTRVGAPTRPAELGKGYPVLVNYWASWCPPCRVEHPLLMQLAAAIDLPILGINHKDAAPNARRFVETLGNPYERVVVDANGRTAIDWGVYGMPETFLVDGRGIVVWKHVGPLTAQAIETQLLPKLAAK